MSGPDALRGTRILLVEDEYFIADDVRRMLEAAGATILGPVGTVGKALEAVARDGFDCAVIDINLHGESAIPLADRLMESGQPFAFATGYGNGAIPARFDGVPRIEKPFDAAALLDLVQKLPCGVR